MEATASEPRPGVPHLLANHLSSSPISLPGAPDAAPAATRPRAHRRTSPRFQDMKRAGRNVEAASLDAQRTAQAPRSRDPAARGRRPRPETAPLAPGVTGACVRAAAAQGSASRGAVAVRGPVRTRRGRTTESARGRGVEWVELEWNLAPTYPAPGLSPCTYTNRECSGWPGGGVLR